MRHPLYSRIAFAKASGPSSTIMLRQPTWQGKVVSIGGPLGSSLFFNLGITISVFRPGSPWDIEVSQACQTASLADLQFGL